WLSDYDANQICFRIEDYWGPFDKVDMSLVRSDGMKLGSPKKDQLSDHPIDLYFEDDLGNYTDHMEGMHYATAPACFPTKDLFMKDDTPSVTGNVGASHYTFELAPASAQAAQAEAPAPPPAETSAPTRQRKHREELHVIGEAQVSGKLGG